MQLSLIHILLILITLILPISIILHKQKKVSNRPKKSIYTGDLQNGIRQGKGKLIYKSGEIYEGNFLNNKRHGHGKFTWESGLIYEGLWENGERSGWGVLKAKDNSIIYEGFWVKGQLSGQGKKFYPHGSYEGHFIDNKENGYGVFVYNNDDHYEGYWLNGQKNGFGILFDRKKQKIFEGTWVLDKYEGEGTEYCELGHYKGIFKGGLKNGNGKFFYNDGSIFEGFWEKGEKCGWGMNFDCLQRKVFEGFWNNGEKNGFGVEFYDQFRFEGQFRNGKKEGVGKMYWDNGIIVPGIWENNVKIETLTMNDNRLNNKSNDLV